MILIAFRLQFPQFHSALTILCWSNSMVGGGIETVVQKVATTIFLLCGRRTRSRWRPQKHKAFHNTSGKIKWGAFLEIPMAEGKSRGFSRCEKWGRHCIFGVPCASVDANTPPMLILSGVVGGQPGKAPTLLMRKAHYVCFRVWIEMLESFVLEFFFFVACCKRVEVDDNTMIAKFTGLDEWSSTCATPISG